MNTLAKLVDNTIQQLEQQNQPKPTRMEIIDQWQSDAERLNLPLVNTTTGTGAPLLDRDEVLRRSYPNYARQR